MILCHVTKKGCIEPFTNEIYVCVRLSLSLSLSLSVSLSISLSLQVDDGLPLRKAALACVNTILDNPSCAVAMDSAVTSFMPYLALGE